MKSVEITVEDARVILKMTRAGAAALLTIIENSDRYVHRFRLSDGCREAHRIEGPYHKRLYEELAGALRSLDSGSRG